jgi:uncharacterized protein (TIGR03067 family)
MAKKLPQRPNLDHLRRQAKVLMSALLAGDAEAARTLRDHLPAAKGMTAEQVRQAGFRLADAQSTVARKTGFASWPQLARYVEQLRALEGTWSFAHLEIDGKALPPGMAGNSRILIDGDCFRTESPEATYEGIFNINVEAEPHEIDIEFVAGPEAGNWNYGIFKLAGDEFELCLDLNGRPRPTQFATAPGSGHAYERLTRSSPARPANVARGTPPARQAPPTETDGADFNYVACLTLTRLQGDWAPVQLVLDGNELPPMMLAMGRRETKQNQVKVIFGGQVMVDALARVDESHDPVHIDYLNRGGQAKGQVQLGVLKWVGDEACINMAAPGRPRPADFTCPPGSGCTLSRWRPRADPGT